MTTYRLNCGHTFEAADVDHELRDRVLCDDCAAAECSPSVAGPFDVVTGSAS